MIYQTPDRHLSSLFSRSRLILSVCSLLLACFLAACGSGGGSTGTVATTTSGNTPATTHPTSAPAASLTTYTGNGFRIGYPAGWTIDKASTTAASVIFVDQTRTVEFIVTVVPNPNATSATSVALDPLLQSMQSKPHFQKVDLAPTTIVGGETWDQIAAIGDLPYSGKPLSIKVNALATNRPKDDASTKMYRIQFSAPATGFDQLDSTTFQPMLQSFNFA
jgi:hypothetical protein